jgi:hypothetical protein
MFCRSGEVRTKPIVAAQSDPASRGPQSKGRGGRQNGMKMTCFCHQPIECRSHCEVRLATDFGGQP